VLELLKELTALDGISGDESEVRDFIVGKIKDKCEFYTDPLGNVIAFKKGKKSPPLKVMLCAHMDEAGLIVTSAREDGLLGVSPVGAVDPCVCAGRMVYIGKNRVPAAMGTRASHNLSDDERAKALDVKALYADIGASCKKEADSLVSPGDGVYFDPGFARLGGGFVRAKAIDDRFGCAALIELIGRGLEYDCCFAFTVQEEIGAKGSAAAAFSLKPDAALIIEATTAADIPPAEADRRCCIAGGGPAVPFMDRMTVYDKGLYKLSKELAKEYGLPWQTKTVIAGGNDGASVHLSGGGVRTLSVSLPCRYIHSPVCSAKITDMTQSFGLILAMVNNFERFV